MMLGFIHHIEIEWSDDLCWKFFYFFQLFSILADSPLYFSLSPLNTLLSTSNLLLLKIKNKNTFKHAVDLCFVERKRMNPIKHTT